MGYKLIFAYDNRGNLTDVTDQDNHNTHYVYDDDSRLTSVTNPFAETTGYEYSAGGRVDKRLLANGCVTEYGYDKAGRVNLVDNRAPGLSVISSFEYERDSRGNPKKITREDGSCIEYGYDDKSQLTSEVHKDPQGVTTEAWEWDYDLSGNRLYQIHNGVRTDYTYNLANQLLTETTGDVTTTYKYDRCGNTVKRQAPEGTTSYRWDHENRLVQLDQPGNVHSYFSYDADGKRVTKNDAEGFTRFIYQGPDMLKLMQELDANGDVVAHYTIGDGLEAMRRGTDSRFYHYDWLGSTFELTDAAGAVTDSYLYDAWGNSLSTTGMTPNPHRYVGRERYYEMAGTGLYHVGHRELKEEIGRFASLDPARDSGNWYDYVAGRPTSLVDPRGLQMDPSLTMLGGGDLGLQGVRQRKEAVAASRSMGIHNWRSMRVPLDCTAAEHARAYVAKWAFRWYGAGPEFPSSEYIKQARIFGGRLAYDYQIAGLTLASDLLFNYLGASNLTHPGQAYQIPWSRLWQHPGFRGAIWDVDKAVDKEARKHNVCPGTTFTLAGSRLARGEKAISSYGDWDIALALGTYTIRYEAKSRGVRGHCKESEQEWNVCYRVVDTYDYDPSERFPPKGWFSGPFCGGYPLIWDTWFNVLQGLGRAHPFDVFAVGCRSICTGFKR